jgi:hypothetical protein
MEGTPTDNKHKVSPSVVIGRQIVHNIQGGSENRQPALTRGLSA